MKFLCANRIAPDGTQRSAASHLGLFCLPVSHKRDTGLYELSKPGDVQGYTIFLIFDLKLGTH